jgi:PII-like signaling protein
MRGWSNAVMVRIFVGEDDKYYGLPLYEAIVLKAREMHVLGATVLRGQLGFGHSSRLHTTKILRLAQDLPLIVEIVDYQERIDAFLPILDEMLTSGLVTLEKVTFRDTEKARATSGQVSSGDDQVGSGARLRQEGISKQ